MPDSPSVAFDIPCSEKVRLAEANEVVDNFVTDPAMAADVEIALAETKIMERDYKAILQLHIKPPPVTLAMNVFIRKAQSESAWKKVDTLLVKPGDREGWYFFTMARYATGVKADAYDIMLRPSRLQAESLNPPAAELWGADVIRKNIPVEPYKLDADYSMDESLRPAVEKALWVERIKFDPQSRKLSCEFHQNGLPVSVSYAVLFAIGDQRIDAGLLSISGPCPLDPNTGPGKQRGGGFTCAGTLPVALGLPTKFDVRLVPAPTREVRYINETKPWGYEIRIKDLVIPPTAN